MTLNPQAYRKTEFIHRRGLFADKPLASNVLVGTLYFSTDTGELERSNGTVWEMFVSVDDGSIAAHHLTHETLGSDAITSVDAGIITSGTLNDARLSGNVALENIQNVFTVSQTISAAGQTGVFLNDVTQAANQRLFSVMNNLQTLAVNALNDAGLSVSTPLVLGRNGDAYIGANIYEKGRIVPLGHWQTEPYSAGNFVSSGATWLVEAGDVAVNRYCLIGKTLCWTLHLITTSLSAPGPLYLFLPAGLSMGNTGGVQGMGMVGDFAGWYFVRVAAGGTTSIQLLKLDFSNFAATTNAITVMLNLTCEVL